ncbi:MAG: hypothetical protein J0L78_15495 [Planctomycetes bacterium]|nr:hypothetical protein [Planctomycetota bacterium]
MHVQTKTALLACLCIPAPAAFSAVTFTSRHSEAINQRRETSVGFYYYNESWTYDQMGTGSVAMTNYSHTSTVTNAGVSGSFSGYKHTGASYHVDDISQSTLEAYFTVSGSVAATIKLNGSMSEDFYPHAKPEEANAYFVIYNASTNAVVFDSWSLATFTYDPTSFHSSRTWSNVTSNLVLGPGNYRLLVGANGNNQYYTGFGQGSAGGAGFTNSMTFADIPAPGALAVLCAAAPIASRRRTRLPSPPRQID